ncbi:MAG: ABC transporter ATP-binding protein [Bauldia sp.]
MLVVDNIHSYYGDAHILHGISLKVDKGTVVTLLGRNGAGKSTTLKSIMGIVPVRAGTITLFDRPLAGLTCDAVARLGIAYVPEGRGIIPNLTVAENLRLGALGSGRRRVNGEWDEIFEDFPALADILSRKGGLLSGGEQQMLALARALVAHPSLILVDEATEGLAPIVVQTLIRALKRMNQRGTSILLVEQRLDVAFELSSHVYVIDQGHNGFDGTPGELGRDTALQQQLLGV